MFNIREKFLLHCWYTLRTHNMHNFMSDVHIYILFIYLLLILTFKTWNRWCVWTMYNKERARIKAFNITNLFIRQRNGKSSTVPLWPASIIAWSLTPRGRGLTIVALISSSTIIPWVSKSKGHRVSFYPSTSFPLEFLCLEPWPE